MQWVVYIWSGKVRQYELKRVLRQTENLKNIIPSFREDLKFINSTSIVINKIHDMDTMNRLLRFFFSNFTIHPAKDGTFRGSTVTYKLNEPWKGFVYVNDFVLGGILQPSSNPFWAKLLRRATPAPPEKQFFAFFDFYPRRISFFDLEKNCFSGRCGRHRRQ